MSKSKIEQVSKQQLKEYIVNSTYIYEVLEKIGYKQLNDNRVIQLFKKVCNENNIDYSNLLDSSYSAERKNFPQVIKCKECGEIKPITEYYISNNKILHTCKNCTRKKQREKYHKKQEELNNYKKQLSCKKCGENRFYLLDFHHINPKEKEYSISSNPNASFQTIQKEIEKCIVLCSNCHREFHYLNQQTNLSLGEYLGEVAELG